MDKVFYRACMGLLLVAPALPAQADGEASTCKMYSDMAASIMTNRQNGMPLSAAMAVDPQNELARQLSRPVISQAYAEPVRDAPAAKQRAIADFTDNAYAACMKSSIE